MAGRRVYGGSNMAALVHKEGITPHAFGALFASSSSGYAHTGFDVSGSSSILNFEAACGNTMNQNQQFYRPLVAEETGDDDDDMDACFQQPEKKRRLTTDKVQFLEKNFDLDNKLEPERKIQLAKDLGLQPRQVAIWFQNRRARWKTKQLEKDYEALRTSYDALKVDYENLQKEKDTLKAEVIRLADKLLVKERGKGTIEASQSKNSENNPATATEESKSPMMGVKLQEALSSTNSTIFDSESPPQCVRNPSLEPAVSSSAFDPDHSDLSHADEEEEEVKDYHQFLKLEDNSDNFAFPVEDQALWFWPNY